VSIHLNSIASASASHQVVFFYRSVGGLRVSLYNAVMQHEAEHLIEFMKIFQEKYSK
jgi:phosphoserine aminotransferase